MLDYVSESLLLSYRPYAQATFLFEIKDFERGVEFVQGLDIEFEYPDRERLLVALGIVEGHLRTAAFCILDELMPYEPEKVPRSYVHQLHDRRLREKLIRVIDEVVEWLVAPYMEKESFYFPFSTFKNKNKVEKAKEILLSLSHKHLIVSQSPVV